jgi:predicted transcriptional regulator YdeE
MPGFAPARFEDGRAMLLAGLRRRHTFTDAALGIAQQWREFAAATPTAGRIGANSYGVMCGSSPTGIEYMCAVEVASFADVPAGTGRMRVPAQRYAVFEHRGGAATVPATWRRILDWLSGGDYASAEQPDFELYRPDSEVIEVWIGVVPRSAVANPVTGR